MNPKLAKILAKMLVYDYFERPSCEDVYGYITGTKDIPLSTQSKKRGNRSFDRDALSSLDMVISPSPKTNGSQMRTRNIMYND